MNIRNTELPHAGAGARRTPAPGIPPAVYCMAVGTFAIGTEGYMIAPLLPRMAQDFDRPVSVVALLITVFTLTLALSSPVLTVLSAHHNRRRLLLSALIVFAMANVIAWASTDFRGILIARVVLAVAAGLYVPNASALAGSIVAPERRGSALAIVNAGTTIAVALGLPLGALVGNAYGWRMTFLGVGALALVGVVGIAAGVPPHAGSGLPAAGFRERLAVAARPGILLTLLLTLLWSTGVYTAYPMISPYLESVAHLSGWGITAMVSLWGVSAAAGVFVSGRLTDRLGAARVIACALGLNTLSFILLAAVAFAALKNPLPPIAAAMALWGMSAWGFVPALMSRMVHAGGARSAPISLALNYSVMYAGFAIGSAIGANILAGGNIPVIMLAAALIEAAALMFFVGTKSAVDRDHP